jgi:RNA polymerase sigma factor (sigma-70 family)
VHSSHEVTLLLQNWCRGDQAALDKLVPLHRLALVYMVRSRVDLDEALIPSPERDADLIALDDALTALAAIDPREAKVVELRFFGGMSVEETAEVLQLSGMTVKRDWNHAKAWLLQQLKRGTGG